MNSNILLIMVGMVIGIIIGVLATGKMAIEDIKNSRFMSDKHLMLFILMCKWLEKVQEGKKLVEYFENNGYMNIAIYGISYVGNALVKELEGTGVKVKYCIDKNLKARRDSLKVVSVDNCKNDVDAIVVTPISFFDEIERELRKKVKCPILSIEDILENL